MDYTNSLDSVVHAPTGNRMHEDNQAVPTVVSDADHNSVIWSLMEIVKSGGGTPMKFNADNPESYRQLLYAVNQLIANKAGIRVFNSATTFPDENIGPIWHEDYNSVMTWQVFDENGADYEGYASVLIGNLLLDTQPTPRTGYIKSGVMNLSKTTYAALWNWAVHNGRSVEAGAWTAGNITVCDNGNGTFKIFDVRGEFLRVLDDGRGIDSGRAFGSWQDSQNKSHGHSGGLSAAGDHGHVAWSDPAGQHEHQYLRPIQGADSDRGSLGSIWSVDNAEWVATTSSGSHAHNIGIAGSGNHSHTLTIEMNGGTEARSRNTALLACIKF